MDVDHRGGRIALAATPAEFVGRSSVGAPWRRAGVLARGHGSRTTASIAVVAIVTVLSTSAAWAVDPFEIQVYDGTANARGQVGLELHANTVVSGSATARPPELPIVHVTHLTLEPSYGVRPYWELGAYLQSAVRPNGEYDFAGTKLRSKVVTPPTWSTRWRFGVNFELSYLPATYEAARWGGEVRIIGAWESERCLIAVNAILGLPIAGVPLDVGPAATALFKFPRLFSIGLEYYGDLGPLLHPDPLSAQAHYLYEVVNLLAFTRWEVNAGVGEGLSAAADASLVAKAILGYHFN